MTSIDGGPYRINGVRGKHRFTRAAVARFICTDYTPFLATLDSEFFDSCNTNSTEDVGYAHWNRQTVAWNICGSPGRVL